MINGKPAVPLSPPTSPRMSDTNAKLDEYQWQQARDALLQPSEPLQPPTVHEVTPTEQPLLECQPTATTNDSFIHTPRPMLRSHKSFPYSLGPSSRVNEASNQDRHEGSTLAEFRERVVSQGPQPTGDSALPEPSYGGSAPTSPVGRLTPTSHIQEQNETVLEDDDFDLDMGEAEDDNERVPKTAAELRAQKRKMKRFRLTHNQTRFLMSEFARQAHPDAAHRERLSREIPGLSPRQVQVWFQNRRAKLKRLTTDDRESMMRSRALPAGFDMTQALHAPFGASIASVSTPTASPQAFSPFGGTTASIPPLTIDTLRRCPMYTPYNQQHFASPTAVPGVTGVTPALGGFTFTPPQSATETMSPASAIGSASAFNFAPQESPRRLGYGLGSVAQPAYASHAAHVPRIHMHDRLARPYAESVGSPLRSSMSYSGMNAAVASQSSAERSSSFSEQSSYTHERTRQSRSATTSGAGSSGLYGLGFSYAAMSNLYTSTIPPQPLMSGGSNTPATLDQFRRHSTLSSTPSTSYASQAASAYATSQVPQYSYWNTGYGSQPSYSSYQQFSDSGVQRDTNGQTVVQQPSQAYTPVVSQANVFASLMGSPSQEPGDNSDGGVPVNPPY